MDVLLNSPEVFPLMRGGGAFLVAIGLGILVGSFGSRRWRVLKIAAGVVMVLVSYL